MRNVTGVILLGLGAALVLGAALSLLGNILPGISLALSTGAAYAWGQLAGGVVVTVLLLLVGLKAIKAGRLRLAKQASTETPHA